MGAVISLDYIQRSRDVDAAIYLLGVLLGTSSNTNDEERAKMRRMLRRIKRMKRLMKNDRERIAHYYRELRM
jgi:hypothetical protein